MQKAVELDVLTKGEAVIAVQGWREDLDTPTLFASCLRYDGYNMYIVTERPAHYLKRL
ncbi:Protein of unknown function [Pyronema omphalodes CBS 100304]|uniref:Uncharacterized protein n=1 Tax=Pyronema omphalodes (strain CBS 100304) TaxID=1076935 RepID=U4KX68_PYROM|nr:Protein of unknown function [Pyronema omphalodes CBS 100304]